MVLTTSLQVKTGVVNLFLGRRKMTSFSSNVRRPDLARRIAVALAAMATLACFVAASTLSSGPAEAAGSSEEMTSIQ